ncbi:lymphocyte antigen 6 family member pge isoform X2 [Phycodurus eques]|uniref:lymphocyte antigen 6 family member pge isoform X2 n=1 Tax=Phycodurus eques TaxID=693459 RepID=UPI002ACDA057|nr:lymphocyte antigen 6 family member pge isoform X2 [Phycodurus eques]
MRALLILLYMVLLTSKGTALQCYTCMASNNEDCNRQGSRTCTSYSDACAVVVGHNSGVMKSCSYKSFCSQANSQSSRRPGAMFEMKVRVEVSWRAIASSPCSHLMSYFGMC